LPADHPPPHPPENRPPPKRPRPPRDTLADFRARLTERGTDLGLDLTVQVGPRRDAAPTGLDWAGLGRTGLGCTGPARAQGSAAAVQHAPCRARARALPGLTAPAARTRPLARAPRRPCPHPGADHGFVANAVQREVRAARGDGALLRGVPVSHAVGGPAAGLPQGARLCLLPPRVGQGPRAVAAAPSLHSPQQTHTK
jgi:hypothetical protein